MYSYGPPHMVEQKQDDQLEHTSSSYVRIRDVPLKTCQRRWTIGRSGERGSGISVLTARHDNDDDDDAIKPNKPRDYVKIICFKNSYLQWIYLFSSPPNYRYIFVSTSHQREFDTGSYLCGGFREGRGLAETETCALLVYVGHRLMKCLVNIIISYLKAYCVFVGDLSRRRPEGSLFNSYNTEVLARVLLLSLDCSTLLLIRTLYCWVLSKEVSSTIFKIFGMMWPGTNPRSPGQLANTLLTWLMTIIRQE